MFVRYVVLLLFLALPPVFSQEGKRGLEIDFLAGYYDQDGEHSPVTGGIGTEDLQSASPVFVINYLTRSQWQLTAQIGVDNITSASTDNIDDNVSSASKVDSRVFNTLTAGKNFGNQNWSFSTGFSKEYDYLSLNGGLAWRIDLNQKNTTFGVSLNHYSDTVNLYDIDGVNQGDDDRSTTDLNLSLTQVLSSKTVGSLELSVSDQSGFLSSPFQEVILDTGEHVAERLPDTRLRTALRFSLNHAFSDRFVQRSYYRYYSDDLGIDAHSLELETHIQLPFKRRTWFYPLVRYHTQTAGDYFGLPGTFSQTDPFFTADRDLSEFTSLKYGIGMRFKLNGRAFQRFDWRASYYDRDDGLSAFTISFGLGWSF